MASARRHVSLAYIEWPSWRIVPAQYPPLRIFEDLELEPGDWEALMEIEAMTDDSVRLARKNIHLIAQEDRVTGQGMGWVMPCFTILDNVSNRFNNHEFGAYYATKDFDTAVCETVYHRQRFLSETNMPAQDVDNLVLNADIKACMHDIRALSAKLPELYHPANYSHAQAFAKRLAEQKSWGIVYNSVRKTDGECVAVFRPSAISNCRKAGVIVYRWDGKRIIGHYKKSDYRSIT